MDRSTDRGFDGLRCPDYIFESSWEVCNKVGGIYTVLSTRAKTLQALFPDHLVFIGPDCWEEQHSPYFVEDDSLFADWREKASQEGLALRIGRWDVPGNPIAVLVDFKPFFAQKDAIYTRLWEAFQVDSLHAYGDYDEASMFSYAAGRTVESFYRFYLDENVRVVFHGNEWMTGLGLLYIRQHLPQVATVFTTHATSIGRSIAGNNKPLYDYLCAYDGDQMAEELNMQSKHSIEKQTALHVDCFTTVSNITDEECKALIGKPADVVLPNGFEDGFVPTGNAFTKKRSAARRRLMRVANALTGREFDADTLIVSTSGRYEFRNKGIDVFIDAMNRLRFSEGLNRQVLAFVEVPAWVACPRADLQNRLESGAEVVYKDALENPYITHWLHNMDEDRVLGMMGYLGMANENGSQVTVIFVPSYLNGTDGIVNMSYYDVVLGNDLTVYPSYYEPWGYTPLESIAFKVPCITTGLAGFGQWALTAENGRNSIMNGVKVIHRTDYNYHEVADEIRDTVLEYAKMDRGDVAKSRTNAFRLSKKALWSHFISYYRTAYDLALCKAEQRMKSSENQ
ncbi:MAG: glycogen/starch synthase [Prevotella sp.]|nr:glycogen/starch synthase [Prevotella sp.]